MVVQRPSDKPETDSIPSQINLCIVIGRLHSSNPSCVRKIQFIILISQCQHPVNMRKGIDSLFNLIISESPLAPAGIFLSMRIFGFMLELAEAERQ